MKREVPIWLAVVVIVVVIVLVGAVWFMRFRSQPREVESGQVQVPSQPRPGGPYGGPTPPGALRPPVSGQQGQ